MKKPTDIKIFSFVMLAYLFFPVSQVFAGITYFVDFADGSDKNSGDSVLVPFKHAPGDENATDNALSTTLIAGDTVFFKGGVQYNGAITLRWDGTSGNAIIYDGNSTGNWGTGRAIIDGQNTRHQAFISVTNRSYVTINHFEMRNMAIDTGIYNTRAVFIKGTGTGIIVKNNYIHEIGYWNNDGKNVEGAGISILIARNSLIDNNQINKVKAGVGINGGYTTTISNNHIGDYVVWGIDISDDFDIAYNIIITGNTIYDLYKHDQQYWGGVGDSPHTDFIFIRQPKGEVGNLYSKGRHHDIIIEKNLFYNNVNFAAGEGGGTSMIFTGNAVDGLIIRNNIFSNAHSYAIIGLNYGTYNSSIYNNTIYNPRGGIAIKMVSSAGGSGQNNKIYNNIIYAGTMIQFDDGILAGFSSENNYFISTSYNTAFDRCVGGSCGYDGRMETWLARGYDLSSTLTNNVANVKFVSTSAFPDAEAMKFSLQYNSPAIDKGRTLTGFSDDYSGTPRPVGSAWDIGAYEFKWRKPTAPFNVRVQE
jgi:hypothetical protein